MAPPRPSPPSRRSSGVANRQWLDLSFNNIEKIENLENLTRLTDLSLCNNRITHVENLDTLTALNVLSLGNNGLKARAWIRRALRPCSQNVCSYAARILHLPYRCACFERSLKLLVYRLVWARIRSRVSGYLFCSKSTLCADTCGSSRICGH
jgi:hypothetical protein